MVHVELSYEFCVGTTSCVSTVGQHETAQNGAQNFMEREGPAHHPRVAWSPVNQYQTLAGQELARATSEQYHEGPCLQGPQSPLQSEGGVGS